MCGSFSGWPQGTRCASTRRGRAVLSLDGGGRYVLDHGATVRVRGPRAAVLERGRLWVSGGGEGGRSEETLLTVGDTVLHLRGARASIAERQGHATISVLAGEVAYEAGSRRGAIRTGETGEIAASEAPRRRALGVR
jgi:hypothetical protein